MPKPDAVRLRHVRDAAASGMEMAAGRTRFELDENALLRMALARCLEVPGEAASKVTPATRAELASVPFGKIVSRWNRLIHAYFDVDLNIVRTTVIEDLPALLPALNLALAGIEG